MIPILYYHTACDYFFSQSYRNSMNVDDLNYMFRDHYITIHILVKKHFSEFSKNSKKDFLKMLKRDQLHTHN